MLPIRSSWARSSGARRVPPLGATDSAGKSLFGTGGSRAQSRMLPRSFQYFAPRTVEEATSLLSAHEGDVKILAGGMSLIPLMKLRLASPSHVVDISRLPGLDYIRESEDGKALLIGALTRHHALESSPLAKRRVPLLSEAAGSI